jgi:predicted nucleic acid-binding protein
MRAIADAGPLVAIFNRAERHHRWVRERIEELEPPLLLCEPVLAEAMFLLRHHPAAQDTLLGLIENGALGFAFRIDDHMSALRQLLRKYRDTPMSLADGCVVQMAEIHPRHSILTLDSDFSFYRRHDRTPLSVIHPTVSA